MPAADESRMDVIDILHAHAPALHCACVIRRKSAANGARVPEKFGDVSMYTSELSPVVTVL